MIGSPSASTHHHDEAPSLSWSLGPPQIPPLEPSITNHTHQRIASFVIPLIIPSMLCVASTVCGINCGASSAGHHSQSPDFPKGGVVITPPPSPKQQAPGLGASTLHDAWSGASTASLVDT